MRARTRVRVHTLPNVRAWLRDMATFKLTGGGKTLVAGGALTAFVGHPLQLPILNLFCALFALGFAALVVNWLMRPRVAVKGEFPDRAAAGQKVTGTLSVTNRSRRPVFDVAAGFFGLERGLSSVPTGVRACLAGEAQAVFSVSLECSRRGLYELPPLHVYTTFPFSVCRAGRRERLGKALLVTPDFTPLEGIELEAGRRYQPGGIALTSHVGESPEYIGNREYRPGDSLRHMDVRSWARLAKPVVREYQEEFYCRIALVLDTHLVVRGRKPRGGYPALEAAVSLCAAVADALSHGEYIIDVFAAGPKLHVFRAGRHTAHFESILEILAGVEACRENPFEVINPALMDELGTISSLVCVFLDWDLVRAEVVRSAQEAGCAVKVVVVRDTPTTDPVDMAEAELGVPILVLTPAVIQGGGVGSL